jgi:DNA-directed RNA polymerase specialized sigma subunit
MKEIGLRLGCNESPISQSHKKALETTATVLRGKKIDSIHAF